MATNARDAPDPLAAALREIEKLKRINAALMERVERSTDLQGNAFTLFETAIALEDKVRHRTRELEVALAQLAASHAATREAKEAAEAAERRLADAIESSNEGFALFDADDRLVLCNQTYLSFWPRIADRITPGILFSDIVQLISDDRATLGAMVAPDRWVSERLARHLIDGSTHVQPLADGRWIQINELRTSDGGIVGIYADITDVKAESARERAREYAQRAAILQATLDAIPEGACLFDQDRKLVAWNGALLALLGISATTMGQRITDFESLCREVGRSMPCLALAWRDQEEGDTRDECQVAGGQTLEVRRAPLPNQGMVLSVADVTETRRTAAALERRVAERTAAMLEAKTAAEQANLSKTRFLAAASHDLLQPLNAARLFVSALDEQRLASGPRSLVRQTESALNSVEDLLEALLEISKFDAGAVTPEITAVPLKTLFGALRAEFLPLATARGLALQVDDSDLVVRSDARLLRRVIQNLLSNALRYTEQGEVQLSAVRDGGQVHVAVRDTGCGIAPEHHEEIFLEFRRLDRVRSNGMGLGLAIVQRAVTMLGHPITLVSARGEGSRFAVELPAAEGGIVVPERESLAKRQLLRRRILVIDNDDSILAGMTALLEGWGCEVTVALNGTEAATRMRQMDGGPADVIIADYHLDEELGDVVVSRLWDAAGHKVPAMIITADRTPALRDQLGEAGLSVLQKPVKPAQLRALLSRLAA